MMPVIRLVLPLLLVIVLLASRKHMLVAAASGAGAAVLLGGIEPFVIEESLLEGIRTMLGVTLPIIYAAAASMVAKAGSIQAVVQLGRHFFRGNLPYLAGFLVLLQGLASYMGGLGAGNTLVISPLLTLAVGCVPEVVAAMAIITGVAVAASPASAEAALISEQTGHSTIFYAAQLRPYAAVLAVLAVALAVWGTRRRDLFPRADDDDSPPSLVILARQAFPAVFLLFMVLSGEWLNGLFPGDVLNPVTIVIATAILTVWCTSMSSNTAVQAFIDGSRFILVVLFSVGIFMGFIQVIAVLGTFELVATAAAIVPNPLMLPAAMAAGFLLAIPVGAIAAGVLVLILPALLELGFPLLAIGWIAMAVGLGTQVSPVQINVIALSEGFGSSVMDTVRNNFRYVIAAFLFLLLVSQVHVWFH